MRAETSFGEWFAILSLIAGVKWHSIQTRLSFYFLAAERSPEKGGIWAKKEENMRTEKINPAEFGLGSGRLMLSLSHRSIRLIAPFTAFPSRPKVKRSPTEWENVTQINT